MTRDPGTALPGLNAWYNGTCYVCGEPIVRNVSRIVAHKGEWRHVACAAGQDDE